MTTGMPRACPQALIWVQAVVRLSCWQACVPAIRGEQADLRGAFGRAPGPLADLDGDLAAVAGDRQPGQC